MAANHPEWESLLATIAARPDDDLVRLAAADWLDEHSDWFPGMPGHCWAKRAELIRLQCEPNPTPAVAELRSQRERELLGVLSVDRVLWSLEACPELVRLRLPHFSLFGGSVVQFRRGFVEVVYCPASEWLAHGQSIRSRQPVREVTLRDADKLTRGEWWEMLPRLRGLERVQTDRLDARTAGWLCERLPAGVYTPPAERAAE